MRRISVILFLLSLTILSFGQRQNWSGDYSFVSTFGGEEQREITFNLTALDTIVNRLDSVFKYDIAKYGFHFMSFDEKGDKVGEGSFHFHFTGDWEQATEQDFDYMLKWSVWQQLHVWEFADLNDLKKDIAKMYICNSIGPGIVVKQGDWITSDKTIQRLHSQIVWRRDD